MAEYDHLVGASAAGTGVTAAVDLDRFCVDPSVQVFGTFVGTYDIERSLDGTNFNIDTTGETAPGLFDVRACKQIRLNVTAYTSGTVEWVVGGVRETS